MITLDEQIEYGKRYFKDDIYSKSILATLERIKAAEAGLPVEPEIVQDLRDGMSIRDNPNLSHKDGKILSDYIDTLRAYAAQMKAEMHYWHQQCDLLGGSLNEVINEKVLMQERAEKDEAENKALREDAERYRRIRNHDDSFYIRHTPKDGFECDLFGHDLDAAIDQARNK